MKYLTAQSVMTATGLQVQNRLAAGLIALAALAIAAPAPAGDELTVLNGL